MPSVAFDPPGTTSRRAGTTRRPLKRHAKAVEEAVVAGARAAIDYLRDAS